MPLDLFISSHNPVHGKNIDSYLSQLAAKLYWCSGGKVRKGRAPKVHVIRDSRPIAISDRSNIVLSDTLVSKLESEAELAFILSHEMSHIIDGDHEKKARREVELKSDTAAQKVLFLCGYDPFASISALLNLYGVESNEGEGAAHDYFRGIHPELRDRILNLEGKGWGHRYFRSPFEEENFLRFKESVK